MYFLVLTMFSAPPHHHRFSIPVKATVLCGRDYEREQSGVADFMPASSSSKAKLVCSIDCWHTKSKVRSVASASPNDELSRLFKRRTMWQQMYFELPEDSRYPFGHPPTIKERMIVGKEDAGLLTRPYSARAGRVDDDGTTKVSHSGLNTQRCTQPCIVIHIFKSCS